jgi:hypothetical protein
MTETRTLALWGQVAAHAAAHGRRVSDTDLTGPDQRWPRFAPAAAQAGFTTVEALPMRLRIRSSAR